MSKTLKSEHNTKGNQHSFDQLLANDVAKGRKVNLPEHIHCMLSKNTNITTPLMRGNCLKDHFNKTCKGKICQIYSCRAHFALKQTFFNFQPSTYVNVSMNSKYRISLASYLNSTLSILAINVIVTPFFL